MNNHPGHDKRGKCITCGCGNGCNCFDCETHNKKQASKLPCPVCGRTRPPKMSDEVKTSGCTFGCGYPLPASDDARKPQEGA